MESYADNDFKDGWLQVVEVAGGDILTSSAAEQARNFLFDMQRVGGCCGWDSTTDLLQNPAFLVCAAPKACKQPFIDWAVKLVLRLSVAVSWRAASSRSSTGPYMRTLLLLCLLGSEVGAMEQELASVSAQRHVRPAVLVSGTSSEEEQNGLEQAETIPFYPVPYEDRPSIFVADHWLRLEQNIFRPNTTRRPAPPVVPARPSTFVGISSYRDGARCGNTLFEVFSKAADPARVTVGVVDQRAAGEPSCLDVYCSCGERAGE